MKIHVRIQDKTFEVQLGDIHARPIQVNVDGDHFEVWPEDMAVPSSQQSPSPTPPAAQPVRSIAMESSAVKTQSATAVSAPIPGVIIEIKVAEGDSVTYGQELCVLEAMKMKNSIRAGHDGTIAKIHISTGEQVQQGKILMEFREKAA
jgi:biotin carboxyl carrier protein